MLVVALTGGIGSGKSTVSAGLAARGASVIDADGIAREVVAPGAAAYPGIVERFGTAVLHDDGTLNRPALAGVVFNDAAALADLNAITHPAIGRRMREDRDAWAGTDRVVVIAIPLLVPRHRETMGLDVVVVVDCPVPVAVERLVRLRHMDLADAEARVAAQITREQRQVGADFVVDNAGALEHLRAEVERLWEWLEARRKG